MNTSRTGACLGLGLAFAMLALHPSLQAAATQYVSMPTGNRVTITGEFLTPNDPRSGRTNRAKLEWKVEGAVVIGTVEADLEPWFSRTPPPAPPSIKISAQVPVRSLALFGHDTTIWLHHFLGREQHPNIQFELDEFKMLSAAENNAVKAEAAGRLSMAGATNRITVPVTLSRTENGQFVMQGSFPVNLGQYLTLPTRPFRMFSDQRPILNDCDDLLPPRPEAQVDFLWRLRPRKT